MNRYWTVLLFVLALAFGAVYVTVGSQVAEISQPDGAYYFGVARHIATTGRFEEPMVWHFIRPPADLVHAPFDYWGCLTALILVPPLAVFGATTHVAFLTMSVISALAVLALWYLVCVAIPLRSWVAQLLAIVLFALSPAMMEYRFQPESVAVAQLAMLLALIAFAQRAYTLALLCGFALVLTRSDGIITFGLIYLSAVMAVRREGRTGGPIVRLTAVMLGCAALYSLWSRVSFGTLTPPGPQMLPFLDHYWAVFDYGVAHERSWAPVWRRFEWSYVRDAAWKAWLCWRNIPFTPAPHWWIWLAVLPGAWLFVRRHRVERLIWLLCFPGFLLLVWLAGPGFYRGRGPHPFTPLIILSGAIGVDAIYIRLRNWARTMQHRAAPMLVNASAVGLCAALFWTIPAPAVIVSAQRPLYARALGPLDAVARGEAIASNIPWYITAYTSSPSLSVPFNGEEALAAAFVQYDIRWLVLVGAPQWVKGPSLPVLQSILAGRKTNLGPLTLERVSIAGAPAVFRVQAP